MSPTALLGLAAHGRRAGTAKSSAPAPARPAVLNRPCVRCAVRMLAMFAAGLILIVALVDPLRGSDQFAGDAAVYTSSAS